MTRAVAAATAAVAALILLTGCSASSTPVPPTVPTDELRVGLAEWSITTSSSELRPGAVRLRVTNAGTTRHDLLVAGPGVRAHVPLLAPGATATLQLNAPVGVTLRLTCTVPGHYSAGMHSTVAVPAMASLSRPTSS